MIGGSVLTQRSREAEGGMPSATGCDGLSPSARAASVVPPLRFKGFDDAWKEKKLGDLDGRWFKGQPLSKDEIVESGLHTCIHYGELFTRFGAVIDHVISRTNIDQKVVSQVGDLLFPASDVTPDGLGRCSALLEENVVLGGDLIGLRQLDCDPIYLSYGVNREHQQIVRLVTGTTVRHSSAEKLKNVAVKIAPNASEQRKIGAALRDIDALIAAREDALDKLAKLKKAMLEKMFPQRGSRVPEVRFKGIDEEWEEKTFDVMFERLQAKDCQIQSDEYLDIGEYPVVDQGKDTVIAYSDRADKVFRAEGNPVIVFGDHTREVKFVDFDFVIGADGTQLLRTNGQDISFGFYALTRIRLPNMGYSRHFKYLMESRFSIPSLPEQRKIGAYFRSLDALISARREEIGKLRDLKKALLDQMFV